MPELVINGEQKKASAADMAALLDEENIPAEYRASLAMARNGVVVARQQWPHEKLHDGDRVEIVKPFVGG